jgi:hypothetical protein
MRFSTTAIFLLLFAAVAGVYVYLTGLEAREKKSAQALRVESLQLLPLEDDDEIDWLHVRNAENNVSATLARENGQWMIVQPVRYAADPVVAEGFVTALRLSTKARRLTREKEWGEYGLDTPALKIGVGKKKDRKRRNLLMGDLSPVGHFVYARWEEEEEYFLLNADLKRVFDQTLYGMRMKRVFRVPLKKVTRVTVQTVSGNYEISKLDNQWYWVEPAAILGEELRKRDLDYFLSRVERIFI